MVEAVTPTPCRLPRLLTALGALAVLTPAPAAFAHRLDEYLQATIVAVEPGCVRVSIQLTPGVAVAEKVLALLDRDGDGVISDAEAAGYGARLKRDLTLRLDGREAEMKLVSLSAAGPAELRSGWGVVRAEFAAPTEPLTAGAHRISLENWHLPMDSAYLFNAARTKSHSVRITRQLRSENQGTGEIQFTVDEPARPPRAPQIAAGAVALLAAVFAPAWLTRKKASPRPQGETT